MAPPQFRAGFARTRHPSDMASDLRFFLQTPRRTYWFAFVASNGLGGTALAPEVSPHAPDDAPAPVVDADSLPGHGLQFDAFAADLRAFDRPPQGHDRAPVHLFSRDLRTALWYDPVALSGGDARATQEAMPVGMFERAGCASRPH